MTPSGKKRTPLAMQMTKPRAATGRIHLSGDASLKNLLCMKVCTATDVLAAVRRTKFQTLEKASREAAPERRRVEERAEAGARRR